jgi:hypothetical protein
MASPSELIVENINGIFFAFDVMPDGMSVLATSNSNGTVWRSQNEGVTWTQIWEHPNSGDVTAGMLMFIDSRGYAFTKFDSISGNLSISERLWRSTDGGQSFSVVLTGIEVNQPLMAEDLTGTLYAGTRGELAEVWRSTDSGVTWVKVWDDTIRGDGLTRHMHGVVIDPVTDWIYIMEGEGAGPSSVYRSKDRGDTWTQIMTLDGTVNPPWVPMGLAVYQGRFYFGSDRPNDDPDYVYRFQDDGLDTDHNIVAEQVFSIDAWIAFWIRTTVNDGYIIANIGPNFIYSRTGNTGSWTTVPWSGGSPMFSHKWSSSGWMFAGSGFRTAPSKRLQISPEEL